MSAWPVTVALVGETGRGGFGHQIDVGFLAAERVTVTAICDEGQSAGASRSSSAEGPAIYTRFEDMLQHGDFEAVAVCTRDIARHPEFISKSLYAGKHVYSEKPLVSKLADGDTLLALANDRGLVFANALPGGSEPRFKRLQQRILNGDIGRPRVARALCKWDHRGGGEDAFILGIHFVDLAIRLFGPVQAVAAQVSWRGQPITELDAYEGSEGAGPVAGDQYVAVLTHTTGVTTTLESVRAGVEDRDEQPYRLEIYGSGGTLSHRAPYADGLVARSSGIAGSTLQDSWTEIERERVTYASHHERAANNFAGAIRGQERIDCSAADGLAAIEVVHAGYWSAIHAAAVQLPLHVRQHPLKIAI